MENRDRERLARKWAEGIIERSKGTASWVHDGCLAAAELVLANTTPPTMAEIEWEDSEHFLAGADHPTYGEVALIDISACTGFLRFVPVRVTGADLQADREGTLTPNGKRYTLMESTVSRDENVADAQPEHPTLLRTTEDYEDAPEGTVVAMVGNTPGVKTDVGDWLSVGSQVRLTNRSLGLDHEVGRVVLRWGWRGQ